MFESLNSINTCRGSIIGVATEDWSMLQFPLGLVRVEMFAATVSGTYVESFCTVDRTDLLSQSVALIRTLLCCP